MVPHMGRAPLSFPALGTHPHSWGGRGPPTSTRGATRFRSVRPRRGLGAAKKGPEERRGAIRSPFPQVWGGAAPAGIALSTLGWAGAIPPASAAPHSLSPPVYSTGLAGY